MKWLQEAGALPDSFKGMSRRLHVSGKKCLIQNDPDDLKQTNQAKLPSLVQCQGSTPTPPDKEGAPTPISHLLLDPRSIVQAELEEVGNITRAVLNLT